MKCSCGECKGAIYIGADGIWVWHDKIKDDRLLMFYDANALVELIKEARAALIRLTENNNA